MLEVPVAPIKPPGQFRRRVRVAVMTLALALVLPTFSLTPPPVQAYTWTPWTVRYYTATANECAVVRELRGRFLGPTPVYNWSCVYRVRSRYAIISDWAGFQDRLFQIENVSPYWEGAWGMKLQVRVHWNGTVARYSPDSLICQKWAFLIKVTKETCTVLGDNTGAVTPRMSYEASFDILWASAEVDRGAQITIDKTGWIGPVVRWP